MATKSTMAIGMLASVTNAPSKINKPPKSSTAIVAHAIKEGERHSKGVENIRERFRPTGELGVAVLHETVAHDQAQRDWPPLRPTIGGQVFAVTTWYFQWAGSLLEESPAQ